MPSTKAIPAIRQACKIIDQTFEKLKKFIKPDLSEIEIAEFIRTTIKQNGGESESFSTLVASGPRSVEVHGYPTAKKIKSGEFIIIDFGVRFNGFHSDCTRTWLIGSPTAEQKEFYNIVLEAQQRALSKVKSDVKVKIIDKAARQYIYSKGYLKKEFPHSTGHGILKRVHYYPRIIHNSNAILRKNMVITIEPGIYKKDFGGVRIEDTVLVTDEGFEVLTKSPKELV